MGALSTLGRPARVGVIGLGTGTLAAYGRPGDAFTFFEIDPQVVALSTAPTPLFRYLRDSPATITIVGGDARLSLEREPRYGFDVLAVDAFSSDSVPVHLLTREAFSLYARHLRGPRSVLAVHVSNRYLELAGIVQAGGASGGVHQRRGRGRLRDQRPRAKYLDAAGPRPGGADNLRHSRGARPRIAPWTDASSNLLQAVRW